MGDSRFGRLHQRLTSFAILILIRVLRGSLMTAQAILPNISPLLNLEPHTPEQLEQLMRLLDEWIADESGYEESTWDELAKAIDKERDVTKSRRLFT